MKKVVSRNGTGDYNCDGVNDHIEIQQAIDTVATAGGGVVYIESGLYDIGATVQLKAKVHVIGEGWTTELKSKNGLNSFPLQASDANAVQNFTLKDFKVNLNGPNQTSNGWVALTTIKDFTIDHVYFYNSRIFALLIQPGGDPITGNQAEYGVIQNCRFDTQHSPTGDFAILNVQHSRIVNNFWGQCPATQMSNYALSAGRSMRHTIIANNTFKNTNMQSIGLEDIQDCVITGNEIVGSGGHGILIKTFEPGFYVERIIVSNNISTENEQDGISLGGGPGGGRIKDSIVMGNICYKNGRDGMTVYGADDCTIAQNHCFNNNQNGNAPTNGVGSGLRLSGGTPKYVNIFANKCYDNQATKTQNWGIYSGNGDKLVVADNTLIGNVQGTHQVPASTVVRDNQIT